MDGHTTPNPHLTKMDVPPKLFFKSSLLLNGQYGIQVCPPASSDDLYLLFCIYPFLCLQPTGAYGFITLAIQYYRPHCGEGAEIRTWDGRSRFRDSNHQTTTLPLSLFYIQSRQNENEWCSASGGTASAPEPPISEENPRRSDHFFGPALHLQLSIQKL